MDTLCSVLSTVFQSTPLREGRHAAEAIVQPFDMFQSTPLREGRLRKEGLIYKDWEVSIHAPA